MVKRLFALFLFSITALPLLLAINLDVEKQSSDEILVVGVNEPAVVEFKITNKGESDSFMIYNLVGLKMIPEQVFINQGNTEEVRLMIIPIGEVNIRGFYTFSYSIMGSDKSEITNKLTLKVIELKDAFRLEVSEINPESETIKIYLKNNVNFNFENINAKISSPFFTIEESLSLKPYERKEINIPLDRKKFKDLTAGFYSVKSEVMVDGESTELEGTIKFSEKDILITKEESRGFIIHTKTIQKINDGNLVADSQVVLRKNIFSRLFTTFNPEPDAVQRQGMTIFYTWQGEVKPGEVMKVNVKTNWLFPFLIIILVIVTTILAKQYSKTNLVLKKKISFVNAKGGEFALKVSIVVNSKKYIERVHIVDRLPLIVKLYERFGGEKPSRVDEKNRKIEWSFDKLEAGEVRVLSYIIYSKIGVLGRFALPRTSAVYEREGEIYESESNMAFFIAEQAKKEIE